MILVAVEVVEDIGALPMLTMFVTIPNEYEEYNTN